MAGAEQGKLRNWVRKTLWGPTHMGGRWRLRAGRTHALSHLSNQSQIQPQLTSDKVEGPAGEKELTVGQMKSTPWAGWPGSQERTLEKVCLETCLSHSSTFICDSSGCGPHRRARGR